MDLGFILAIALIVLAFFVFGYVNEKKSEKEFLEKLQKEYGQRNNRKYGADELKAIKGYYRHHKDGFSIDDITWNDLDMWSVYKQMNYCKSSAGDEYLYYLLKNPHIDDYNWDSTEKKISWFKNNQNDRIKLQTALAKMGRSDKYSLFDYIDKLNDVSDYSNLSDMILCGLYIPAVILCFINALYGVIAVIALIVINVSLYFKKKSSIEPFIVCFNYVNKILVNANDILNMQMDVIEDENLLLASGIKNLKNFKRFYFLVSGNAGNGPAGIVLDYFRMFTHADLIKFKSLLNEIRDNRNEIKDIVTAIGKIDCYISIGEYRTYLKQWCMPVLSEKSLNNTYLEAVDIYHPLLENAVANSITVKKGIILTGSNASGKSTFLKTVALNILLAQSIHTVCAKTYAGLIFALYTSLNLKDSISSGDSYYLAEIKAIKRILEAKKSLDVNVIGFVDEVLRGTNTTERIAASSTILYNMSKQDILVMAATHDLELTSILSDIYENYHFVEEMSGDDVSFPYKISSGKAESRNAIKLLNKLGFDENITSKAQNIVDNFEQKGVWSL